MQFKRFLAFCAMRLNTVSFKLILVAIVLHMIPAYLLFLWAGETKLTDSVVSFVYYYMVTASSIGYGDLSPSTELGRAIAVVYLIPFAFALFAAFITKLVSVMLKELENIKNGLGDFENYHKHLVIVGYVPKRTDRLIRELSTSYSSKDIVVVSACGQAPANSGAHWVKADSLANLPDLVRSGIKTADRVVIMGENDQETLLASLAVNSLIKTKHVVAYFDSHETAAILEKNCANIETVTDNTVDQLGRALEDPGSSHVIANLVSVTDPVSLRSAPLSNRNANRIIYVKHLAAVMLNANATLVGYGSKENPTMTLKGDDMVANDAVIYYIAEQDLDIGTVLDTYPHH